jgi:hypothetical protein
VLLGVVTLFSWSCATPEVPRLVTFKEADFARTGGTGSGTVAGQAFTVLTDKSVRYGKDVWLLLLPVNAYTTESIQRKYIAGENLADGPPRYQKYLRSAQADDQGNFAFRHVPPGDYYVGTTIDCSYWYWNADGTKATVNRDQYIYATVSVQNGQTVTVTEWSQAYTER